MLVNSTSATQTVTLTNNDTATESLAFWLKAVVSQRQTRLAATIWNPRPFCTGDFTVVLLERSDPNGYGPISGALTYNSLGKASSSTRKL